MSHGEHEDAMRPAPVRFEPIELTFRWTEADYVRAVRHHHRRSAAHRALLVLLPVAAVLVVVYWALFGREVFTNVFTTALVVVAVIFFGMRWWALPAHARRAYRQHKALHRPIALRIDERGYANSQGESSHALLPWEDCHRWLESPEHFLVYASESLFHLIPKRELNDEQIDRVRALLEARIAS